MYLTETERNLFPLNWSTPVQDANISLTRNFAKIYSVCVCVCMCARSCMRVCVLWMFYFMYNTWQCFECYKEVISLPNSCATITVDISSLGVILWDIPNDCSSVCVLFITVKSNNSGLHFFLILFPLLLSILLNIALFTLHGAIWKIQHCFQPWSSHTEFFIDCVIAKINIKFI